MKIGVVGLGIRGFWLSHCVRECPDTELTAMADMQPGMLNIAKEKFPGVELFTSGEEMVKKADIEAVLIATGDRFHAGNAREALTNGKHALIEKPMAQSFDDLVEIARLQKETGLTVGTFLEMRQNAIWKRAKEIIDSGTIGRVLAGAMIDHVGRDHAQFFARARTRSRKNVVSLVLQKGVHSIDLLNWLMDSSPRRVSASGGLIFFGGKEPADKHCSTCDDRETCPHSSSAVGGLPSLGIEVEHGEDFCVWSEACDVEDLSLVNIEYAGGTVACYHEIHFAPYYGIHATLYSSKAQLDIVANHDTGEAWIEITERYSRKQHRERPSRDIGHGNADNDLIVDFVQACRSNSEPLSGLRAGFESAAIAVGSRQSLDEGAFVDLPRCIA